jgi:flagellar basal-body rod protein FlgF
MLAMEKRQEVVANNIANASTPGYRRQQAVNKGFDTLFFARMRHPFWANRVPGPGGGLQLVETFTDAAPGPVTTTGNPLDVALEGPGFLAVDTPAGERYTRSGSFTVNTEGLLVTHDGHPVLNDAGGTIAVRGGAVQITGDGTVIVDNQPAGTLRMVEFEDIHFLSREGDNLYAVPEAFADRMAPAENTRVSASALEYSNVQLPYEMIQMTLGMRLYEANQRSLQTIDQTMGAIIEQVGMPQ